MTSIITIAFSIVLIIVGLAACVCGFMVFSDVRAYRIALRSNIALAQQEASEQLKKKHVSNPTKTDLHIQEAGYNISASTWYGAVVLLGLVLGVLFVMVLKTMAPMTMSTILMIAIPLLCVLVTFIASEGILTVQIHNRTKKIDRQLARALPQVAENLRAGISLEKAITAVSKNAPEPLASELHTVVAQAGFDSNMAEAFRQFAQRTGSNDILMLSTAIKINQQRGGNLSNTIYSIARTLDTRQEMRRYCDAAMAATKTTAWLLCGMSILIMGMTALLNTEQFVEFFFNSTAGLIVLVGCGISLAIGVWLIYKIGYVEVD